ncbi:MAG: glutathione S-transferase family protein [Gammaproteobacteria bacterium]|jgi:glutathione S-transferase
MTSKYKLVSFSFCPYVQRSRIVMLEKHIPHSVEYISLDSPPVWFHDVSPLEKVPVLMVDDTALFESMPICEYLDEISEGSLYPDDPLRRAQHRAWIEFSNELLGLNHRMVTAADETGFKQARAVLTDRLETVEEILSDGPFFAGEAFGMVDAIYAPLFRIYRLIRAHAGLELIGEDMPGLAAWADRLLAHASVKDAVPDSFEADYLAFLHRQKGPVAQMLKN